VKRTLTAIALAVAFTLGPNLPAQAHHQRGPCAIDWRLRWVRSHDTGPIRTLIRCAVAKWPVPGGAGKALSVANCESGFRPSAVGSGNAGVFQHRLPFWQGRFDSLTSPWWRLRPSIYNGRTNVIVSIRYANRYGWGAWSCA
jgi:hypothetical protein